MVKKTERGWAGHFICGSSCRFRRNTLLELGEEKIVVSTVGGYVFNNKIDTIGANGRYYETMAFKAVKIGAYFEADVSEEISFESEWAICAKSPEDLPDDIDNMADRQHEAVVLEMTALLEKNHRAISCAQSDKPKGK